MNSIPYFFAAMFQSYLIQFRFANPVVFPEFILQINPPAIKWSNSSLGAYARAEVASVFGGVWPLFFRFSGGDSENNTRSHAAVQIGRGGACRGLSGG
ncbi:hypothetical protein FDW84_16150 [Pseudarthrobacter sp. NamE5]|nr:hypothetical protein FDW84_16150 [Pseudarthrobacter sp. NamE5]